jgi:hypothetical protein
MVKHQTVPTDHGVIYYNAAEHAGWPFMYGMWRNAADDILVGFKRTPASYGAAESIHHDRLTVASDSQWVVTRSRDGAQSWETDRQVTIWDYATSEAETEARPRALTGLLPPGGIDFTNRNTLIACASIPTFGLKDARPVVRVSLDGGDRWLPPIFLDKESLPAISGNGSPMVRRDGTSLLFMTQVSADGWTRRPLVFAYVEAAQTWRFLSFITPRFDDGAADGNWQGGSLRFGGHRWFYPRGIQCADGRILCALRSQRDPTGVMWTEMFQSEDGGLTWHFLSRVNEWGAPGDIVQMADGRIVCVYGYRLPPYGIRARVSEDGGRRWGPEIVLRDDGGSWDLGYPRVMELSPGRLMATYYFNRKDDPIQATGGVRHIAQTIFTLD